MSSAEVFDRAGLLMARYAQSLGGRLGEQGDGQIGTGWLPKALRPVQPFYTALDDGRLGIEFGGGFYHYGYVVSLDADASTDDVKVWNFEFYRELGNGRATTIRLPASERISDDEIVATALAGYDEQINLPGQHELRGAFLDKVRFLVLMRRPALAVDSCEGAVRHFPDHWLPRLTLALLKSPHRPGQEACVFHNWVDGHPSWSNYFYLAYMYQQLDDRLAAGDAVARMLEFAPQGQPNDGVNVWFMGYNAAVYAYRAGCFAVAERLCSKLLDLNDPANYVAGALREIRVSAARAQAASAAWPAVDPLTSDKPGQFDPFNRFPAELLVGAATDSASQPASR